MKDAHDLERFVRAQQPVMGHVLAELRAGRKESHWMWFVFPQLRGLGSSAMADKYGIGSREEAQAFLLHPVLGPRLRDCTRLVNAIENHSAAEIFGYPDDRKFQSSMTLFAQVAPDKDLFEAAIRKYFNGEFDSQTLKRL